MNTEPFFHNKLILYYRDSIKQILYENPIQERVSIVAPRREALTWDYSEYVTAGNEPGQLGVLRLRLITLIKNSKYYNAESLLSQFPIDALLEERAILLSKLNRHKQALQIYVNDLFQPKLAEKYCDDNYDPNDPQRKDIYLQLLNLYLYPENDETPKTDLALAILNKKIELMNYISAISLLPPSMKDDINAESAKIEKRPSIIERLQKYVNNPFIVTSHKDCVDLLRRHMEEGKVSFDEEPDYDKDFTKKHEFYVTEELYGGMPVFVRHYPKQIKAFYMPDCTVNTGIR